MHEQAKSLSIRLSDIAKAIEGMLYVAAGEEVGFVLVCNTDGVTQYVANVTRESGSELIRSVLERFESGRADIPAHYSPDIMGVDLGGGDTDAGR